MLGGFKIKTQTIELFGRKLKIEVPYDEPRKKFTTQISETNYKFIKELSIKSHKEISVLCDVMINTIKDNDEILGEYFKNLENY